MVPEDPAPVLHLWWDIPTEGVAVGALKGQVPPAEWRGEASWSSWCASARDDVALGIYGVDRERERQTPWEPQQNI